MSLSLWDVKFSFHLANGPISNFLSFFRHVIRITILLIEIACARFTLNPFLRKIIGVIMMLRGCSEFSIYQSLFLCLVVYFTAISQCLSTRIPSKYPVRFNIESQKHGSLLKGKYRVFLFFCKCFLTVKS